MRLLYPSPVPSISTARTVVQRVLWLLEELGVGYDVRRYERDPKTMLAPASLRAVHPLGKSPVITENGLTIAESGAIIEYLIERHGEKEADPTNYCVNCISQRIRQFDRLTRAARMDDIYS